MCFTFAAGKMSEQWRHGSTSLRMVFVALLRRASHDVEISLASFLRSERLFDSVRVAREFYTKNAPTCWVGKTRPMVSQKSRTRGSSHSSSR